jgi:annexin A6
MKDLKSELSKNLERLVIGLMLTPAEFDAKMMRKAIEVLKPATKCQKQQQ